MSGVARSYESFPHANAFTKQDNAFQRRRL